MNGQRRPEAAPTQHTLKNIEAGGEADAPLATSVLLQEVADIVSRYVVLPGESDLAAIALFVLHTWAIEGAHATPYLVVISPERRTGKSRLLEVLRLLVRSPWHTTLPTEATLIRKIEQDMPTLLLDEIDAIFGSSTERTEPLRAVLDAGNRRGATVPRVVGQSNRETRDFNVFCPKVLAGIDTGRLPDTIRDRAVVVHMKRRHDGEPIRRFRERKARIEAEPIRDVLAAWAMAISEQLSGAEPDLPDALNDRAAEAWEPLLAIADLAGGRWPEHARGAALALSADDEADEVSRGVQLLGAIRRAFGSSEVIATVELLKAINENDELPFGGWREGQGIDARIIARLLRPYAIKPTSVRVDDAHTPKGYRAVDFYDAWARYLPAHEPQRAQQAQQEKATLGAVADVADVADVAALSSRSLDADAELARLEDKGLCLDGEVKA
jgi:hypothetical protein